MTTARIVLLVSVFALSACSGGANTSPANIPAVRAPLDTLQAAPTAVLHATGSGSFLSQFDDIVTIGSTVDPLSGDVNPYGLDIARTSAGKITAGDLVVCNFNAASNVQGTGSTIVALHPRPGATPVHIARLPELLGCTAVATAPSGNVWSAAFVANDDSIVDGNGKLISRLDAGPWRHPFGQTFALHGAPGGGHAFYESNAQDGSIVRIVIGADHRARYAVIATGFAVNGGAPGGILGPSGLQYDAVDDGLYIVDGADNSVTAFEHVSMIPANGITVHGATFGGPFASRAHRIFHGAPLNGPISSALMPGGNLIIGNTLDPNGTNLMVEITSSGHLVATKNVDTGAAGAIFGMVASGADVASAVLYFNDDNDNTVKVLKR